jgi:hypothetical protein
VFFTILTAALAIAASAQNVQQATCITPQGNPNAAVGATYLHGWFDVRGNTDFVKLEASNRRQLQALANRTGQSIAIPLSENLNSSNGYRQWDGIGFNEIKKKAKAACGSRPAKPGQLLLGFSNGGYRVRDIAINCEAKKPEFAAVLMVGARARNGRPSNRSGCAKFYAVRGIGDGSTNTCVSYAHNSRGQRYCASSIPFSTAARNMVNSLGGNAEVLPPYQGDHVLPPNDLIARAMGTTLVAELPPPIVPTATPQPPTPPPQQRPPPPAVVVQPPPPAPPKPAPRPVQNQIVFTGTLGIPED